MDFSRRRFLTVATSAASSLFIPLATHGAAADIVAAVPDRYAIVAAAWREALDVLPGQGTEGWLHARSLMDHDAYMTIATAFSEKADNALGLMLNHFKTIPTKDEVTMALEVGGEMKTMDEEQLRLFAERLVPLTTMTSIMSAMETPFMFRNVVSFCEFTDKYKSVLGVG